MLKHEKLPSTKFCKKSAKRAHPNVLQPGFCADTLPNLITIHQQKTKVMFSVMSNRQSVILTHTICALAVGIGIRMKCRFVFTDTSILNENRMNKVVPGIKIEWTFHLKSSFPYVIKFIRPHLISLLMILLLSISKMSLFCGHNSGLPQL